jgi:acetolactate synthase-1/2/3 large subunit
VVTGAESMIEVLRAGGVRRAYTVPGESFLGLLDGIDRDDSLQLISTRHESGASFMAEGDAKISGVPAVVMATRGVGAANLAIGVHTAMQDSTPMVAILGQVESEHLGREGFQEVDLTAFYSPITKLAMTATRADRLPELTAKALRVARSGRPGPVMIAVPADMLEEEIEGSSLSSSLKSARSAPPLASITGEVAIEIAHRLSQSQRPVIIEGGGAKNARAELIELSERGGIGVYASFRRQDGFPNDHPNYLGHLGLGTPDLVLPPLRDADLVLVIGARLSEVTTQGYTLPAATSEIIQIDIENASLGAIVAPDISVISDTRLALLEILRHMPTDISARVWTAHVAYMDWSTAGTSILKDSEGIDPALVIDQMMRILPADTIIGNDAGNFAAFLHRYWRYRAAYSQLAPTSGAMGYAIPAAIGGGFAQSDRAIVTLAGDGGFLMTGQELETAVRYHVPLTAIVFNNGIYGTIAMHQAQSKGRLAGTDISRVDIAGFARSLGAHAVRVDRVDEFGDALKAAVNSEAVNVIEVRSEPDLIAPGRRLSDMLTQTTSLEVTRQK